MSKPKKKHFLGLTVTPQKTKKAQNDQKILSNQKVMGHEVIFILIKVYLCAFLVVTIMPRSFDGVLI